MTRALVQDLVSPHPLGAHLPALYQSKDPFALGLAGAFDEVLAPIFASLDNLEAYLDPKVAPADFLDWLGTWVAVALDGSWTLERRRELVAQATALHRVRGTARGLKAYLEVITGGEVEIQESGGTAWSTVAGEPFPGRPDAEVEIILGADGSTSFDPDQLDALVAAAKPANVRHRVTINPAPAAGAAADEENGS